MRLSRQQFLAGLLSLPLGGRALAQTNTDRQPIRLILSTSPGGGADTSTRLIAPLLTELLGGQSIVIESRSGGAGLIAGGVVAREAPDGHTFLVDITTHSVNPALKRPMPYKVLQDLVPVTQIVQGANVLVVHPSLQVNSLSDFVALAKERKGTLSYASSGSGSAQHLAMEMFKARTELEMTHVPYRGGGPALIDLVSGHVQAFFAFIPTAAPHISDGKIKALATTGSSRAQSMPNLPTIAESGYPGFESYDWNGIFAPAGTPDSAIRRLQAAVAEALKNSNLRQRLADIGMEPVGSTPEDFRAFIERQIAMYSDIVQRLGLKVE